VGRDRISWLRRDVLGACVTRAECSRQRRSSLLNDAARTGLKAPALKLFHNTLDHRQAIFVSSPSSALKSSGSPSLIPSHSTGTTDPDSLVAPSPTP
jgi:hypothetical protein